MRLCKSCQVFPAVIDDYCKNCSPKKIKQKKPINRVSKKRAGQDRVYETLRKNFLSKNTICIANFEGCLIKATDLHHSQGRGEFYLDVSTYIPLCRVCHRIVEDNPSKAKELGLSGNRLN